MKSTTLVGSYAFLAASVVLVVALCVSCNQALPFKFTVSIPLGTYDLRSFDFFAQFLAGTEIPAGFETPALPVCDLPTQDEIRELVSQAAGDWVANLIVIDEMELQNVRLSASSGDFDSLTGITLQWNPKPVDGSEQPPVDLGAAHDPAGLGAEVVLVPGEPVDFLELIENDAANPAEGCPSFQVGVEGVVPDTLPVWEVTAEVEVVGTVHL